MGLLLFEHLRTAHESLRRTRTRTYLTVTGVAIGIASITAIFALSGGITNLIARQIEEAGDQIALVRPAVQQPSLIDLGNPLSTTAYTTSPLVERDLDTIQSLDSIELAAPLMTLSGTVRSKDEAPKFSTILATTPEFSETTPLVMKDGQFIDGITQEDTAVLGEQLALDLFGTDQAVGKQFTIRGQAFTCIGVIKRQKNPINYNNVDLDHGAIISLDSGKLFNEGVAQIQQINVKAKANVNMPALKKEIDTRIAKNHGNERDTNVLIGDEITQPTSRLFLIIGGIMSTIAGISLIVGGIGIMNIMLVSVAERTREIGLRKAVGATSSSIVAQFMIEAFITSALGGIVGYIGGYGLAFVISMFLPYDPVFLWETVYVALGLSIGVGVLFGLYPALKAARKNPIESLRRYH